MKGRRPYRNRIHTGCATTTRHGGRGGGHDERLLRLLYHLLRLSLELSLLYHLLHGLHGDLQRLRLFVLSAFYRGLMRLQQSLQLRRQCRYRLLRLHERQLRVLRLLRSLLYAHRRLLRQFGSFGRRSRGGIGARRTRRRFMLRRGMPRQWTRITAL